MKVLSLFSGVGGFDLGLERAGMETVFQCEWDKHATKILERHWPDVPRWDDVSTLTGKHILAHAPVIDVVAWGSPCQDLSIAGKRAGLEGSRSGLFHEGIRIIKELRKETNNVYPRISLWENVYGALSSNKGADFGVILDEMAEAGSLVQEWRVLDAQYFGVPQRRRRVFLVSVFDTATAARCPNPLLPVSESVRRDTPTSGTPRQEPARAATQGTRSSRSIIGSDIVGSLNASDWKFPQQQQVHENKCVVETFTKAKRAQTSTDDETWVEGKPAPTLNAFDQGDTRATTVIVGDERTYRDVTGALLGRDSFGPNHEGARDGKLILEPILIDGRRVDDVRVYDPPVQTLQARMGTGGNNTPMVALGIQGNVIGRQDHNGPAEKGHTDEGDPMFTLTGTDIHAVAYTLRMREGKPGGGKGPLVTPEKSGTLAARSNDQTVFQPQAEAYDQYNDTLGKDVHHSLRAGRQSTGVVVGNEIVGTLRSGGDGGVPSSRGEHLVTQSTMAVRRLTPIECERLMGWPDGWTEGQADTHRYKQCGNGVASPVATWIAQQLIQLDKEPDAPPTTTTT